jgi:hypothetical protein
MRILRGLIVRGVRECKGLLSWSVFSELFIIIYKRG